LSSPQFTLWILRGRGINAVSLFVREPDPLPVSLSLRSLLIREPGKPVATAAAWDNAFVNIPLLLVAAGIGGLDLRQAVVADVGHVVELSKWVRDNRSRLRPFRIFGDIKELSQQHQNGGLPVVLGGGAWLAKGHPSVHTVVPTEGALFWVEAAGLISASETRPEPVEFLTGLLDDAVQLEIASGPQYDACPVRPQKTLWAAGKYDIRKIFRDERLESLRPELVPRRLPPQPGAWEDLWADIKKLLMPQSRNGSRS
jgi:hypothetical protein